MRPSLLRLLRSLFCFLFLCAQRCPRVLIRVPFRWIFFLLYTCCSSKNGRKMENQGSSICFHGFLDLSRAQVRCLREESLNLEKHGFQEIVNPAETLGFLISSAISSIFRFDQDRFFTHEI
ncbi:hypothetical protein D8674_029369 [Pyrus ussuriensis x Pyrus communis]|uniref:Secreted protein n=1 Tax=Pyrus ussuriensis x Pyrus communis TaxID=2448454 RepID=A0A5N5I3X9_9ROSA|nr:hypothetical protein D8674_029369 [Pyrus ussuriensis x Pyrus communis]